jgi:hypothetical protein
LHSFNLEPLDYPCGNERAVGDIHLCLLFADMLEAITTARVKPLAFGELTEPQPRNHELLKLPFLKQAFSLLLKEHLICSRGVNLVLASLIPEAERPIIVVKPTPAQFSLLFKHSSHRFWYITCRV